MGNGNKATTVSDSRDIFGLWTVYLIKGNRGGIECI